MKPTTMAPTEAKPARGAGAVAAASPGSPSLPACLLERLIGRPAATWTVDDLVTLAAGRGVRLVSLMHVGGDGWLKVLDFVPRSREHLRDILSGGERADGSSLFAGLGPRGGGLGHPVAAPCRDRVPRSVRGPADAGAALRPRGARRRAACRSHPTPSCARPASGWCASWASSCTRWARSSTSSAGARARRMSTARTTGATTPRRRSSSARRCGARPWPCWPRSACPVKYGHSEVGYVQATEADGLIWEQHEIELGLAPLRGRRRRGGAHPVGAAQPRAPAGHALQLRSHPATRPRRHGPALPLLAGPRRGAPRRARRGRER